MAQFQFHNQMVEGDMLDSIPVPPGRYAAMIDKTEIGAPNEKGTVQLMTEWVIIDGQHKDRKVRNYTTIECPTSDTARDIGLRFLKNICESVGIAGFSDTDELCNRPHIIEVVIEKRQKGDFATVKRTYPSGATSPAPAPAAPAHSAPAQAPTGNLPPWARK
jgi:hypothetical protein